MLAYRTKWHIKEGHIQEAVELLQKALDAYKAQGREARIYYEPQVSPRSVLVWEEDWEDPDEHDKFWAEGAEVHTGEGAKEFWARWAEVVEGEAKNEVWSLLK